MPSHAPGPAGNGGNVNKPAVRLTRILSAGLMTSSSRQGGRDDDYFFTFISFPLFLCPSLWAPACLPSRPVRLSPTHPVFGVLSLPFLSVLRTGEEYHVRRASRRQRSCKKRANGNASVVASRPPRRHTRAPGGVFAARKLAANAANCKFPSSQVYLNHLRSLFGLLFLTEHILFTPSSALID